MKTNTIFNGITCVMSIIFLIIDASGDGSPIWVGIDMLLIAISAINLLTDEDLNF